MRVAAVLLIIVKFCATQDSGPCGVVPIMKWAGTASHYTNTLPNPVNLVIIQHTVYGSCVTDEECEKHAREIRAYHINKRGFIDIGPSFLVGGNGKVYEGAGWSHIGTHTTGYNSRSIGLSFLGDFRHNLPTSQALQAAKNLISCGVERNFLAQNYQLVGHMQVERTESPGTALQNNIKTWPHWVQAVGA